MPSVTLAELPHAWHRFLSDVDDVLPRSLEIHCLGGFVAALYYDLPRPTNDLDYVEVVPQAATAMRLDPHDLALSKLARNSGVDREDVAQLARAVPLDPALLRARYERELRPIIIGDRKWHDQTIEMWIEAYFRAP